jgi:hypothetical protein
MAHSVRISIWHFEWVSFLPSIKIKANILEKNLDWVFATNVEEVLLENILVTFKKDGELKLNSEFKTKQVSKNF